MNSKKIIYIILALIVIAGLAVWFSQKKSAAPAFIGAPENEAGLGGDIYNQVAPKTAGNLPETNPFKAETNPFKAVQTNPFGQ